MKIRLNRCVLLLSILLTALGPTAFADDVDDVRAANQALQDAMNNGNAAAIATFLHPDYSAYTGNGSALNKGFDAAGMQKNFDAGLAFDTRLKDVDVQVWGDTALVTAYIEGTVSMPNGMSSQDTSRVSSTWLRVEGKWMQVHLHNSPLRSR